MSDWNMVRLSAAAYAALCAARDSLLRGDEDGRIGLPYDGRDRVGFSAVVLALCEARLRHSLRRRASKRRRAALRAAARKGT